MIENDFKMIENHFKMIENVCKMTFVGSYDNFKMIIR